MLAYKPNNTPNWARAGTDPDQIVGTWSSANSDWLLWDVSTPKQYTPLPTPTSHTVRHSSSLYTNPMPPPKEKEVGVEPRRLRFTADRKTMAMSAVGLWRHKYKQGDPEVIFWSFPTMEKLGSLQVGDLVERNRFTPRIDLAFSEYKPGRMWVWRIAPQSSLNAWWKGAEGALYDSQSTKSIGPRLELRENPSLMRKDLERDPVDYRLKAAVDLPITVEMLAEHPDGRHVLVYGQGTFPSSDAKQGTRWRRGFAWLKNDTLEGEKGEPDSDVLKIVTQFELPLVARSIRFTPDGQLLIGTAAGTVELYELR